MSSRLGVSKTALPKSWAEIAVLVEGDERHLRSRPCDTPAEGPLASASRPQAAGAEALPFFLVSYELGADWTAEGYKRLYRGLRSFRSWTWLLDSVWMIQASSADLVRDVVGPLLGAGDGLVIVEISQPVDALMQPGHRPPVSSRRGQALAQAVA